MAKLIIGGTFNPIHKGHIKMTEDALKGLLSQKVDINEVLFLPTIDNLRYKAPPEAKFEKGSDMIEASLDKIKKDFPKIKFSIDDTQVKLDQQYAEADIFKEIKNKVKDGLYYALGADCIISIGNGEWPGMKELLNEVSLVCVHRPDSNDKGFDAKFDKAVSTIINQYSNDKNSVIKVYTDNGIDISSTDIRNSVKSGRPIIKSNSDMDILKNHSIKSLPCSNGVNRLFFWQDIVGEKVAKVIAKNNLYDLKSSRDDSYMTLTK